MTTADLILVCLPQLRLAAKQLTRESRRIINERDGKDFVVRMDVDFKRHHSCFMVTLFPGIDDNGNDAFVLSSYEAYLAIKRRHPDFQLQVADRI